MRGLPAPQGACEATAAPARGTSAAPVSPINCAQHPPRTPQLPPRSEHGVAAPVLPAGQQAAPMQQQQPGEEEGERVDMGCDSSESEDEGNAGWGRRRQPSWQPTPLSAAALRELRASQLGGSQR
jgi:hypothetical protein